MQIKSRHYPHPVLSSFDDALVGCSFTTKLNPTTVHQSYRFQIDFHLIGQDLQERIHKGQVCFALHVECIGTRARQLFQTQENTLTVEFSHDQLDGKVELCTFILGTEAFDYQSADFHEDYEGASFSILKGDVLAVGEQYIYVPTKEMDPLVKVPSIFTVSLDPRPNARDFDLALDGPKVVIQLSQPVFDMYRDLAQSPPLHSVLSSLVILPALTSLLEEMRKPDAAEQYEDKRWYQKIKLRLRALGIELYGEESMLWMAQQIIGLPLTGALKGIQELALAAGGGDSE